MSPLLVPEVAEVFSAVGENMVYVFYSFFFFKWVATFRSQRDIDNIWSFLIDKIGLSYGSMYV